MNYCAKIVKLHLVYIELLTDTLFKLLIMKVSSTLQTEAIGFCCRWF